MGAVLIYCSSFGSGVHSRIGRRTFDSVGACFLCFRILRRGVYGNVEAHLYGDLRTAAAGTFP